MVFKPPTWDGDGNGAELPGFVDCHKIDVLPNDAILEAQEDGVRKGRSGSGLPGLSIARTRNCPKAMGRRHTVLLQSSGRALGLGANKHGQCNIPEIPSNLDYVQVATGTAHSVLLRSDGRVVACGDNRAGQCDVPLLEDGLEYVQVSAGGNHTLLLRSDGKALMIGDIWPFRDFPEPEGGEKIVQVDTGPGLS
eukprot:s4160_g2.t1